MLLKLAKQINKPIFHGQAIMSGWMVLLWLLAALTSHAQTKSNHPYQYFRTGSVADVAPKPTAGFALMGGGTDQDDAFRWLCRRANGGDFLILRASGDDDYNSYVQKLCPLNSVATLILPSRAAAEEPFVAQTIARAEAIFIAGGDQANYIRYWTGTPVQEQLNAAIQRGVPLGGTSAGLAVMGEWVYSAEGDRPGDPNLDSRLALTDPWSKRITLVHGFLNIPILRGTITDTHFAKRDRMGRLLTFLMRLSEPNGKLLPQPRAIRGIGVEERTALLVEPEGQSRVAGSGSVYFLTLNNHGFVAGAGQPLLLKDVEVQRTASEHTFNLKTWRGEAAHYTVSAENGTLHSSQPHGAVY